MTAQHTTALAVAKAAFPLFGGTAPSAQYGSSALPKSARC